MIRFLILFCAVALGPSCVLAQSSFHGYPCSQDCSGHKAGFAWAEKKGIISADQCGGKSSSFREGCYAWLQQLDAQAAPALHEDEADLMERSAPVSIEVLSE